jgi:hypothetical protein
MSISLDGLFYKPLETPVIFFIYNRPELTKVSFEAIRGARPKFLFIISDGPKDFKEDTQLVLECREIVKEIDWECDVNFEFSEKNLGLRERFTSGLDAAFLRFNTGIILEDDCIPSIDFFFFCSAILAKYENSKIGLVSGFNNGFYRKKSNKYFFSTFPEFWGWATWAKTWNDFRASEIKQVWCKDEMHPYFLNLGSKLAARRLKLFAKKNLGLDAWNVEFSMHLIKHNILTAIPRSNLIINNGFGASATYTKVRPPWILNKMGSLRTPLIEPSNTIIKSNQYVQEAAVGASRTLTYLLRNSVKSRNLCIAFFRYILSMNKKVKL